MNLGVTHHVTGLAGAVEYEPLVVDGVQIGEEHCLRGGGSHDNRHDACLWRTDAPARYEYVFEGDESFVVLEGSTTIEILDTGEKVELKAGDVASFDEGTRTVWTFSEPFKKFTVISS